VNINDVVKILNGYTRGNRDNQVELHVGERSQILKEDAANWDLPDATENSRPSNEVKIEELTPQSKNVKVIGEIIEKEEPREVNFNDGTSHKVCDVTIGDETGNISLSIWDDEIEKIEKGKTYCIENGYVSVFRGKMKLNAGKFGLIKKIDVVIKNINHKNKLSEQELEVSRKTISDIRENEIVEIFGTIISIPLEQKPLYNSCPTCHKKVNQEKETWNCERCGTIQDPVPRMLWSLVLDDGTENIRVTVVGKIAEEILGITTSDAVKRSEEEIIENELIISKWKELIGQRIVVKGTVRLNGFSSNLQIMANSILIPNSREELVKILARVEGYI
jgi:replication factor A1